MDPSTLRARVLREAGVLGLERVGVARADASDQMAFYRAWLEEGHHGEMGYLARPDAVARRADLRRTLEGLRSVVVVADPYPHADPPGVPDDPSRAVIARYARGADYHDVLGEKLHGLLGRLRAAAPGVEGRAYIDTGPILERDLARRAGLGWQAKNTMLIDPGRGSWFFLGVLLLDAEVEPDAPFAEERCGTCRACLEACPTGALLGRGEAGAPVMDARRCISYLTIELRGPIPRALRPLVGNRVFGCDICQEVCPWNLSFAEVAKEVAYSARAELDGPALVELAGRLLSMSGKGFQREFAGSPLQRAGRKGLLRNVCVALGNWGSADAVPVLSRALEDPSDLVREHAAWALGRVGTKAAAEALDSRIRKESDLSVLEELGRALSG